MGADVQQFHSLGRTAPSSAALFSDGGVDVSTLDRLGRASEGLSVVFRRRRGPGPADPPISDQISWVAGRSAWPYLGEG
jgi:hypothetical protein